MNELIKEIKSCPWGVKVALLFLFLVFCVTFFLVPKLVLLIIICIGVLLSILRIDHYLKYGD